MERIERLRRGLIATWPGVSAVRIAKALRGYGPSALDGIRRGLSPAERLSLDESATSLVRQGIDVVLIGEDGYPAQLVRRSFAAPALFYNGSLPIARSQCVGVCGARRASPRGLQVARLASEIAVDEGFVVVSGHAGGVDTNAHVAAVQGKGSTALVLPEGIERFRPRAEELAPGERVVVISQFGPSLPWSVRAAMARNKTIFGLSAALLVVEAGPRGGTLNAGLEALREGLPVLVLRSGQSDEPEGNVQLLRSGATAVSGSIELRNALRRLATRVALRPGEPAQLSLHDVQADATGPAAVAAWR